MDDKTRNTLQPSATFAPNTSTHLLPQPRQATTLTASPPQFHPYPSITSIVSPRNHSTTVERKTNPMDIQSSLMSPPDAILQESFSQPLTANSKMKPSYPLANGRYHPPLSPPVSPESKASTPDSPASVSRDPILFPSPEQSTPVPQPPLFFDAHNTRLVDEHVRARDLSVFRKASPPRIDEYQMVLEFKSQIAMKFNANRRTWHQRELAQLKEDDAIRDGPPRKYPTLAPASNGPRKSAARGNGTRLNGNSGVVKPVRAPKPPRDRQSTPDGGPKRVAREDKDFNSLPDYSPPVSSLPNKPNSLKVDWKGAPIDLKSDPHVHMLHPDEVMLAANLRLDCATYLTSKRRIFIKRIEAFRINKEFRKTDAQQACKIDVNKASKLWAAFDKVGWLHQRWIEQYA